MNEYNKHIQIGKDLIFAIDNNFCELGLYLLNPIVFS
jgi:hypothetical protein